MATTVEEFLVQLDASTEGLRRELRRASKETTKTQRQTTKAVKKIQQSYDQAARTARNYAATMRKVAVAAVALASGRALGASVNASLKQTAALKEMADQAGLTAQELQIVRFAAASVGVQSNVTDTAMRRLARRMGEAAEGTGVLLDVLERNDIALRNADGSMRSTMDVLRDLARATQEAASDQERLVIANRAFDIEGTPIVNLLREGTAEMDRQAAAARRLGLVWDENLINKAATSARRLEQMNQVWGNVFDRIVAAWAPKIRWLGEQLLKLNEQVNQLEMRAREKLGITPGAPAPAPKPLLTAPEGAPGAETTDQIDKGERYLDVLRQQTRELKSQISELRLEGTELDRHRMTTEAMAVVHSENIALTREQAEIAERLTQERDDQLQTLHDTQALMERMNEEDEENLERARRQQDQTNRRLDEARRVTDDIAASTADLATQTRTWGEALQDIARRILPDLIEQLIRAGIGAVASGAAGGGGAQKRQAGGPVAPGRPYLVGERGPELMVPGRHGTVVPNHRLGAVNITQNLTVNGGGGSVRAEVLSLMPMLQQSTVQAVNEAAQRGGPTARAVGRLGRRR